MNNELSLLERLADWLRERLRHYRLPFFSALGFGLLAHMYAFSNKLLNADEISALFSKGATVTSGRWGLELTSYLFPNVSMPWIYGLISLLLLACAACMTVGLFRIRRPLLQVLLAGLMVCFPAIMGNFCFLFTSASYALSIWLAVLSACLFVSEERKRRITGVLLLSLSLGIYQAYISLVASFLILHMLQQLLAGERCLTVLKRGIGYLGLLLAALLIWCAVTFGIEYFHASGHQDYEVVHSGGLLSSLLLAYRSFVGIFLNGLFGYVNSKLSLLAHLLCLGLGLGGTVIRMSRKGGKAELLLALLLLLILPLSINSIYLIASVDIIHTLVLYSFVSVYILAALVLDQAEGKWLWGRDALSLSLAVILAGNVFFCNKVYLKMALQYENAYAFYNTLLTQIMETPGFNSETVIDFVGNEAWGVKRFDEIDTSALAGPNEDLVNIYTRVLLMKYYLGVDLYSYREDLIFADWYEQMPSYPDPGSIMMDEQINRIVVKLA